MKSYGDAVHALEKAVALDGKNLEATKQLAVVSAMSLVQSSLPVANHAERLTAQKEANGGSAQVVPGPRIFLSTTAGTPPGHLARQQLPPRQPSDLLQCIEAALAAKNLPSNARQLAERHLADRPGDPGRAACPGARPPAEGRPCARCDLLEALVAVDPETAPRSASWPACTWRRISAPPRCAPPPTPMSAMVMDCPALRLPGLVSRARRSWPSAWADRAAAQREALAAAQAEPDFRRQPSPHRPLARRPAPPGRARRPRPRSAGPGVGFMLASPSACWWSATTRAPSCSWTRPPRVYVRWPGRRPAWGATIPIVSPWDMRASVTLPGPLPSDLVAPRSSTGQRPRPEAGAACPGRRPAGGVRRDSRNRGAARRAGGPPSQPRHPQASHPPVKSVDGGAHPRVSRPMWSSAAAPASSQASSGRAARPWRRPARRGRVTVPRAAPGESPASRTWTTLARSRPTPFAPANPADAGSQFAIGKLASRLEALNSRRRVRSLGGADVIPFDHLPDPTDDVDPDISVR